MLEQITIDRESLTRFARRNVIRTLSLFGSVLRPDFRPDSDVDVLVEFEQGTRVGLFRLAGLELELSQIIGRKVDLRTPANVSRYFRDDVIRTALVQYDE